MPIKNPNDAAEVESRIARIFAATPPERAAEVRALFVEVLDFDAASGCVDLGAALDNVVLPTSAERIATMNSVNVVYIPLSIPGTDRVRKGEAAAAAKHIADQLQGDLLLVFTNTSASQLHLVYPSFQGARPVLRRMVVERDLPRRTAVQQVSNIYWNHRHSGSIVLALDQGFDVEPVTREFFSEYKRVFEKTEESVTGFEDDDETKRRFVQTMFNRLMFVYFLSRKGWLSFNGDKDYLNALWQDYRSDATQTNFYRERLKLLFFFGLNNPQSIGLNFKGSPMTSYYGDVPFLNGGLFEKTDLDKRDDIDVPDEAIRPILSDLFDRFNFTVMESTPFDVEVAVDPEMLGKVFEELVTGRHASGAYYTPRPVVSFMCREALKGYLQGQDTGVPPEALARFVDERDTSGISVSSAKDVAAALDEVTVVDPACGSGAYLLGMMQELVELQSALFNVGVDAKGLYELKLHIIERNLYGVDIDDFAANIAMLRLWLSLAIEYEGDQPEPLPNLDFKVVCGDSLLGPDPSVGVMAQSALGRYDEAIRKLDSLKAKYMRARTGPQKQNLREDIRGTEELIKTAMGDASVPEAVVDWRLQFAEVFAKDGGFNIAIANPPYVQLQRNGGLLANRYKDAKYTTLARTGDMYQLFFERGCQALRASGGMLTYITSNSWLKAEYGKKTRQFFADGHTPLRLLELGKDVFESAIVDSGVLVLRTGGPTNGTFPGVDMDRLADKAIPPEERHWGQVRPDGAAPWSILSRLEQSVLEKMLARGTPLKEWDIAIYRGITTGLNEAFIIDNETKEAIVAQDPGSEEIIKPVVRGRDIRRYQARWAGLWLIDAHNGYENVPAVDINDYPAIKAHLDGFYDRLAKRYDKGRTPYNLRNCAYHANFGQPKLFWADMAKVGRFAFSERETYCNNKGYLLTGESLKYLCAILNSSLITWWVGNMAATTGMGLTEWTIVTVERLPIPKVDVEEQGPLVRIVDRILDGRDSDAELRELESQIDRIVYSLYGLTEHEVDSIESR